MGEIKNVYKFWLENLKGRGYLENLGTNSRLLLKGILKK
jgi:hypothetical protein